MSRPSRITAAAGTRITTLDRAMCPRFHVDRVPVRLIVTWGGPGTQWLAGRTGTPIT